MEQNIELNDILFKALDLGVSSISDNSGPLIAFALIKNIEGKTKLQRFITEKIEDMVKKARDFVKEKKNEIELYAIA